MTSTQNVWVSFGFVPIKGHRVIYVTSSDKGIIHLVRARL